MKYIKLQLICVVMMMLLSLVGCKGHSNSLLTSQKDQAVKFLVAAEEYASEKTHLYDATASTYVVCVKNPKHFDNPFNKTAKNPCDDYLKAMLSYAKTTKKFNNLSIGDLNDQKVVDKLGDNILNKEISR